MTEFSLLQQLQNKQTPTPPLLPRGVKYDDILVTPHDTPEMLVHIPISESASFREAINQYTVLVKTDVRNELRKHRGIIGK